MLGRRALAAILGMGAAAGALYFLGLLDGMNGPWPRREGRCDVVVTRAELERSVELGTRFLLVHQKDAGNFDYLYDWKAKTYDTDDNEVRQAGALWGLALLHQFEGPPKAPAELKTALGKSLAFFDRHAGVTATGGRFPVYVGKDKLESSGGMGMAALVALATIDHVRGLLPDAKVERDEWTARANAYVNFLVASRNADGLWHGRYDYDGGAAFGNHSPYSDGEALLALVKAMKYLGREDLAPLVKESAAAGHRINIEKALAADPDSDVTKGFYQWSSMAFYELATSKWGDDAPYGEWLLELADWMIDVHRTLERPRNTGYAYEGIVPAYAWAKGKGDKGRVTKYGCVIHTGLGKLMSWQVGHPRAIGLGATEDPKAIGGVQNHNVEPGLRIDVVQHQMHGTMLALRHLNPK